MSTNMVSSPSFLVESLLELDDSAAFSGVLGVDPDGKLSEQPTQTDTKRAAIIAPTNNDNRPSVSTLRVWVNSGFSELPPPILFMVCIILSILFFVRLCKDNNNFSEQDIFLFFPPPFSHPRNHARQFVHHEARLAIDAHVAAVLIVPGRNLHKTVSAQA